MANSRYEYVRKFEQPGIMLDTWIVVRIDGRGFHKFSARYNFEKPNDQRALDLMNAAAAATMKEIREVIIAYGVSDEFSFVFHKSCTLFERRESKIVTTIVSTFTAYYIHLWSNYFPDAPLSPPLPTFDGRAVCYPTVQHLRDYMSWRQVDCHINNLYNTTFWTLVLKGGMTTKEAEQKLSGTMSEAKHEILFSEFGMNYNNEPAMFKKGSVLFQDYELDSEKPADETPDNQTMEPATMPKIATKKKRKSKAKPGIAVEHCDIIKDQFWELKPWILSGGVRKL